MRGKNAKPENENHGIQLGEIEESPLLLHAHKTNLTKSGMDYMSPWCALWNSNCSGHCVFI